MNNFYTDQEKALLDIILTNNYLKEIIYKLEELNIPECYVGAGIINQSVWNKLSDFPINHGIKDIDIVYFDPDISYESEDNLIHKIKNLFKHIPMEIDIKNQARVHLWYKNSFGFDIKPYISTKSAIDTWPTTATCIGIRKINNNYEIYAPFGLDDLLNMIVRPNKILITKEIYDKKVDRWRKIWSKLKIIDW